MTKRMFALILVLSLCLSLLPVTALAMDGAGEPGIVVAENPDGRSVRAEAGPGKCSNTGWSP